MDGACFFSRLKKRLPAICGWALLFAFFVAHPSPGFAQEKEANWIWSNRQGAGKVSFFRKPINLREAAEGSITIAAGDRYQLFINGKMIGQGVSSRQLEQYDISTLLTVGRNVVAVRVDNGSNAPAGLAIQLSIRPNSAPRWYDFHSDASWKVATRPAASWQSVEFDDQLWGKAVTQGVLGQVATPRSEPSEPPPLPSSVAQQPSVPSPPTEFQTPPPVQSRVASEPKEDTEPAQRFQVKRGFGVQRLLKDDEVGSIIALAFNEFGHIIASQEGGPLLLIFDRDGNGVPEEVRTYCDQVTSCQGILPLNGEVFVTGEGPEGTGLYRLLDRDRNGTLEEVIPVLSFQGAAGEHGPHGITLGPDGMIYLTVGNHMQVVGAGGEGETLPPIYEGDLIQRFEDPGGHATGIRVPGGTIIRTSLDGKQVERVAGGIRNAYDLAFHPEGGLFIHDSDMESDLDTAWYRPTMLFDVVEGADFGWRSGWAKWPEYYLDRLPALAHTGRGSPTGSVIYEHHMFPVRYHNALFLGDWSEGRILVAKITTREGRYEAETEVFLQGQPLNVTDLAVGPDGAIYFGTGGRGTNGGIYRIVWQGQVPDRVKELGTGIARAIRQPQLDAAWGRQEIAGIKKELGSRWGELVAGVAYSDDNPPHYRLRALNLMQLFGPVPSEELLLELSQVKSAAVRAKAAYLMGVHPGDGTQSRLGELLRDPDHLVCRTSCEAILRSEQWPASADLLPLLDSQDRSVAFAARRVLEKIAVDDWLPTVMASQSARQKNHGLLAAINADPSQDNCLRILSECSSMLRGFLSDADFVDTLRVMQVALHVGKISPESVQPLANQIAEEFPTGEPRMNHELIRLATYLQCNSISDRLLDFIESDAERENRIAVAMYLPFFDVQWEAEQRFRILKFYEQAAKTETAGAMPLYIMNATKKFSKSITEEDAKAILEQASKWPNAALASMYRVQHPLDDDVVASLLRLDQELSKETFVSDLYKRLRTGTVALLATSDSPKAMEHLRSIWRTDPTRRQVVAMGLAQRPDGENWDYLVRSLNIVEGDAADEVMRRLASVPYATDDPAALRDTILLGLKDEANGRYPARAHRLLSHWTGSPMPKKSKDSMKSWQAWFATNFPDQIPANLPDKSDLRWNFEVLDKYLDSDEGDTGDPRSGALAYEKAQCAACHRFAGQGQSVGPDLTTLAKRFTRREALESILYPSHVIPNRYRSKRVLLLDGRVLTGMVVDNGDEITVRDSQNRLTSVNSRDIDQILPGKTSIMPAGLLDDLSLNEISDMMAYLGFIPPSETQSENQLAEKEAESPFNR